MPGETYFERSTKLDLAARAEKLLSEPEKLAAFQDVVSGGGKDTWERPSDAYGPPDMQMQVIEVQAVHGVPFDIPAGWAFAELVGAENHDGGTTVRLLLAAL